MKTERLSLEKVTKGDSALYCRHRSRIFLNKNHHKEGPCERCLRKGRRRSGRSRRNWGFRHRRAEEYPIEMPWSNRIENVNYDPANRRGGKLIQETLVHRLNTGLPPRLAA